MEGGGGGYVGGGREVVEAGGVFGRGRGHQKHISLSAHVNRCDGLN